MNKLSFYVLLISSNDTIFVSENLEINLKAYLFT